MSRTLEERTDTIHRALDTAATTIAREEARLVAGPRWYRTGTDIRLLHPHERSHADRLDRAHRALDIR